MNIGSYLQFGNMLKGVHDANQQALVNQQNQQRINDLLANDALLRQIDQQNFQDYLAATKGIGTYYRNIAGSPIPVQGSAPASAPGQNSANQPMPPNAPAQSSVVPNSVPLPSMAASQPLPPNAPAQGIRPVSLPGAAANQPLPPNAPAQSSAVPSPLASGAPPVQQKQGEDMGLPVGTYGRVLAMAQNNQAVNLAARAAASLLKANPNMTDRELGATMNMLNPTLTKQADNALQIAGLSNTEMFKAINLMLRQQRLGYGESPYTQQQLAVAADMIRNGQTIPTAMKPWVFGAYPNLGREALQGKARQAATIATSTMGPPNGPPTSDQSGNQQQGNTQPNYDLGLAYLNGTLGATGGLVGAARQRRAFQQLAAMGLPPSAEKPYQNDLAAARNAQTQLLQRATMLQATSGALDTQLNQATAIAKQLNLKAPVVWNGGKIYIDGKALPTDSPVYSALQTYNSLVADASREAGAQQMFGKATVAGLKNGAQVVDANKGEGLLGVLQGLRDGAQASIDALNHTITAIQVMPALRIISKSSNPKVAAQAFGFTPISVDNLKTYAKLHKITDDQAAMSLSTQPNHPYYVIGYPYGQ